MLPDTRPLNLRTNYNHPHSRTAVKPYHTFHCPFATPDGWLQTYGEATLIENGRGRREGKTGSQSTCSCGHVFVRQLKLRANGRKFVSNLRRGFSITTARYTSSGVFVASVLLLLVQLKLSLSHRIAKRYAKPYQRGLCSRLNPSAGVP